MNKIFTKDIQYKFKSMYQHSMHFALVKYGGGVIQMSGSIAGNTYARNRFGNYVRSRTKPVNPNTARQVQIRAGLAMLTTRWAADLTQAQRDDWALYASNVAMKNRLGETVYLTGFNHYLRSGMIGIPFGEPSHTLAPVIFELPEQDPLFAVTASEATQQITVAWDNNRDWTTETGGDLYVFQGKPQNFQRTFFGGPWRAMGFVPGIDPAGAISPAVMAAVFPIAEGQRVWCYARIRRADARLSQPFRDDVLVGA